jgi:Protein YTP1-like, C-terminal
LTSGGIFFNYGIITLGRYLGVFADLGWAWNLKPPGSLTGQKWKDRAPTAEFVESFFICLYGATQSFMEHLGNRGDGLWSAKDLQHESIAIMFFWAGLCGILIETPFMRRLFNRTIEAALPSQPKSYQMLGSGEQESDGHVDARFSPPPQQTFSYNPFPGLIIFMTGMMMSMHHQHSMLSTMIHKQWGYLLAAFALFRLGTYIILFINPPTSYIPTRPVTELLTSFCLICGGIIFMVLV